MDQRHAVLVVDDDPSIREMLAEYLSERDCTVFAAADCGQARELVAARPCGVVLLDIGLPGEDGLSFARYLRERHDIGIIILSGAGETIDRIIGLEIGADDYLAKPFSPRELTARIRAVLRRSNGAPAAGATPAGWAHDAAKCRISFRGQALELTRNEYRLLAALLAAPGRVFSRDQLMTAAWDDPGAAFDRTVDAHIKTLRAKLRDAAPDADPIVTHRGLGYSLRES